MKRIVTVIIMSVLCLSTLSILAPKVKAEETTTFSEDFEGYSVGSFPSLGGWQIVWNGMGDQYQYVSNAHSSSPTKSLHLWGQTGWSCVVQRKFSSTAPVIGYEFEIYFESRASNYVDNPGFFKQGAEEQVWGTYYANVNFDHADGKIKADDGTTLGDWIPKTWYKVRAVLDRTSKTYIVWINGQLKGSGLTLTPEQHPELIDAIALTAAWPGVEVYYDDVKVFESSTLVSASIDVDPSTLDLGSKGKWITAYTELPDGYDVANINASSITLNGTIPAEHEPNAIGDYDGDGTPDLMFKFDRAAVIGLINALPLPESRFRDISLTVTGKLDDGTPFQGTDTIKVISANS